MSWMIPTAISVGSSLIGGIMNSNAEQKAAESRAEWARYNAQMGFDTTMGNIATSMAIADINASLGFSAAEANMKLADYGFEAALLESDAIRDIADYNANIIEATSIYNSQLLGTELTNLWQSMELDLLLLEQERARERGTIRANQGASGTVMDDGTNAAVIVSQKTQEKLDAFVIRHGANVEAGKIQNTIAQSLWQGQVQAQQTRWEGEVRARINTNNAMVSTYANKAGAINQMNQTAANFASSMLNASAGRASALSAFEAGMTGAEQEISAGQARAQNSLTQGLFNGLSSGVSAYYAYKPIGTSPTTSYQKQTSAFSAGESLVALGGSAK